MINYTIECLEQQEILLVGIIWIGHTLQSDMYSHKQIMDEIGIKEIKSEIDGSEYFPRFELNHLGQAICINEYSARIA